MAEKLFGIETIKKDIAFGLKFGTDAGNALEDGKLSWDEYPVLLGDLMGAGNVVATGKDFMNEVKDLDSDEAAELRDFVKKNFDIADDLIEEKIEAVVTWVAATYDMILVLKKKATV